MKKPELTIPTILGILVAIGGLVAGIYLLRSPLLALVGASPEEAPQKVKITNVTENSFVVSWTTVKATSGFVQYGEKGNPELVVSDDRDQEKGEIGNYFTHLVTVRGLKATTEYSFRIGSGRNLYDQQGQLYKITTGVALRNPPAADVAYGQVMTASGDPAEGAIVYASLPGVVPQATLIKSSGSWVIPLATARTTDLTSFAVYDKENTALEIFVEAGGLGTATVVTTTGQDSPVATITLGTSNAGITGTTGIPTPTPGLVAVVTTPTPTPTPSGTSRFSMTDLQPATEATGAGTITILTPKSGEKVNTDQPEIMGKAPPGAVVQITIESPETITATVKADAEGDWSYSVPQDLTPGQHTVTVSTVINGVVKKVTRSFVVQAAGESTVPVIVSTPSATLAPRVAMPSTTSGVPVSGSLTPTLVLTILGIGLVVAGLVSYKHGSYSSTTN